MQNTQLGDYVNLFVAVRNNFMQSSLNLLRWFYFFYHVIPINISFSGKFLKYCYDCNVQHRITSKLSHRDKSYLAI